MKTLLCVAVMLLGAGLLGGCASSAKKPPTIALDEPMAAAPVAVEELAAPAEVVVVPEPLPLPGQLKPLPEPTAPAAKPVDPQQGVTRAIDEARVAATHEGLINAMQVWPFVEGALYQVYVSPHRPTVITLQPGEQLVDIAGGDTARWIVGDTVGGGDQRVNVVVRPMRADLQNSLAIITDRRIYFVELIATEQTWMASVSWDYPQDRMRTLQRQAREASESQVGLPLEDLRFRYAITGANAPWRPRQAFDDGRKVYIQFPAGIAQGELPPLFVVGPRGEGQLVNYRYLAPYYVVDRLFGAAELRLGGDRAEVVRIERTDRAGRR